MKASENFEVTVIIPVFNAREFILDSVNSALLNKEVKEVILVFDGSQDGSYERCIEIAETFEMVRLYTHKDLANKGAAASRNLGVLNAKCEYVSFLDADDVFIESRFTTSSSIFKNCPDADGVYEAIGVFYENELSEIEFKKSGLSELTTVSDGIKPNELFECFMKGGTKGHFSIVGLVIRRDVLLKNYMFNTNLELYEDTLFIFQISTVCNLYPGDLERPVALRRVHSGNRITKAFNDKIRKYRTTKDFWRECLYWAYNDLPFYKVIWVAEKSLYDVLSKPSISKCRLINYLDRRFCLLMFVISQPYLFFVAYFWKLLLPRSIYQSFINNFKVIF
jgi:glycosyltransferase involved in cell wall biosynthesis